MKWRAVLPILFTAALGASAERPAVRAAQEAQFRSGVDVVELNVAVLSGRRVVSDLKAEDFEVTDNGVKQQVLSATRESLPVDVTMVVDTSESLTESLVRSILSAVNRIRERLRPEDRVSLITFNHRIQERVALLPPPAVKAVEIGRPAGQTSLNDALAVVMAQRAVTDRRQMAIVFTDGYDSTSILNEDDVMNIAGRSSTAVFIVAKGIGPWANLSTGSGATATSTQVSSAAGRQPIGFFHQVAEATGGIAQMVSPWTVTQSMDRISAVRNDDMLDESFVKALDDFRSSYVVRYSLAGVPRAGWHAVAVKVTRPGRTYSVRTRTGYMGG